MKKTVTMSILYGVVTGVLTYFISGQNLAASVMLALAVMFVVDLFYIDRTGVVDKEK